MNRALAEVAYWYFLMTMQGGPDGSELDEAVRQDMFYMLWETFKDNTEYRESLLAYHPYPGTSQALS